MFKLSMSHAALAAALGLVVFAGSSQAAGAYFTNGDLNITIDYYDSGTVGYTRACSGGLDCDAAVAGGQTLATTPGSGLGVGGAITDTQGIFQVNKITRISTGASLYDSSFDNYLLTGIFSGLVDIDVQVGSFGTQTRSDGGGIKIWSNTKVPANAIGALATQGADAGDLNAMNYPGISGGTLFLSGLFSKSAMADGSLPEATFQSSWSNDLTGTGSSSGFIDLDGTGTGFDWFAQGTLSDFEGRPHDLYFSNSFNLQPRVNGWNIQANTGQIVGNPVPEPSTIALAALALLGIGFSVRAKKS